VIYFLLSGIIGLIFRIKIVNPENEPDEGGFVVCANHISATDPIMLSYAFRNHQVCFIPMPGKIYIILYGFVSGQSGIF
jgi:1-acyl-sn-glycerol-3-phosphate acyltransferase